MNVAITLTTSSTEQLNKERISDVNTTGNAFVLQDFSMRSSTRKVDCWMELCNCKSI